jgi:hypothetical protein
MIFKREDEGEVCTDKCSFFDLIEHIFEENVGAHGFAVRYN